MCITHHLFALRMQAVFETNVGGISVKWQVMLMLLVVLGASLPAAQAINPPGMRGGAGHGRYWHRNPVGPRGGAGSGWIYNPPGPGRTIFRSAVNPPGPVGGAGHGPRWHYNPAGCAGGPGRGWIYNNPGPGRTYFPS